MPNDCGTRMSTTSGTKTTNNISPTMALGKKPYPKATVKKIIKAHSNHNIKKNADVTVRPGRLSIAVVANVYLS